MLLKEHETYHKLSPKDVFKTSKQVSSIDVMRSTNSTGEQFHAAVPVYEDDSREELWTRTQFFLSLFQDRMIEENKAVDELNQKAQKIRMAQMVIGRNRKTLKKNLKDLAKDAVKNKWDEETIQTKRKELLEKFEAANKEVVSTLQEAGAYEEEIAESED